MTPPCFHAPLGCFPYSALWDGFKCISGSLGGTLSASKHEHFSLFPFLLWEKLHTIVSVLFEDFFFGNSPVAMDDPFQASLRPRRSLHMLTHFYGFGCKDVTFQGRVEGGDRNPWRYHPSQLRGKAIRREAREPETNSRRLGGLLSSHHLPCQSLGLPGFRVLVLYHVLPWLGKA